VPALPALELIAQAPDLRVFLDVMLAGDLIGRNLDLSAALAMQVDHLPPAEIIERRICVIDEATAHHSPDVECGEPAASLMVRHLASRIRSRIAWRGREMRRSNFGPGAGAGPLWRHRQSAIRMFRGSGMGATGPLEEQAQNRAHWRCSWYVLILIDHRYEVSDQ